MGETQNLTAWLVTGVGLLIILALLLRCGLEVMRLPAVVGFLGLGIVLSALDANWELMRPESAGVLEFLSAVGVIVLLFRVGVESDIGELLGQLPRAAVIWLPNMLVSGGCAWWVMSYWLDYSLVPSLFVSVAMTATSVGVSLAVWEALNQHKSDEGKLLVDTAELDDVSGVALMALLFTVVPTLHEAGQTGIDWALLGKTAGMFFLKLLLFVTAIIAFGRFLEKPFSKAVHLVGSKPVILVFALALGLSIAGAAGLAGLSLPIGALFAGLLLSRHRDNYGIEPFYTTVYALFVPFFFIHIGYMIDPTLLGDALTLGLILIAVAVVGKLLGTAVTAWRYTSLSGVALISVSMVPRAEITMVVIERGRQLGDWAMPPTLYAAMIMVSGATCLASAVFLHWALRQWR